MCDRDARGIGVRERTDFVMGDCSVKLRKHTKAEQGTRGALSLSVVLMVRAP